MWPSWHAPQDAAAALYMEAIETMDTNKKVCQARQQRALDASELGLRVARTPRSPRIFFAHVRAVRRMHAR